MGVLFPATQQIPIEIDNDPSRYFMAWLLYGTPNTAISHIIPMQDYKAFETTKMVSHLSFSAHFALASCFTTISLLPLQMIVGV